MKLFVKCDCGCDVLCIEKILSYEEKDYLMEYYYFNMYRSYPKNSFITRLKRAWEYFRKGEFAYSDILIKTDDLDKMIEFLNKAKESEVVE